MDCPLPQIISICICPVSRLESKPGFKIFMIEDESDAATLMIHVVHLGVTFDRHPRDVLMRTGVDSTAAAKAPGVVLKFRKHFSVGILIPDI